MLAHAGKNHGLTLIEVVVALLVLSIGLVALAGVAATVTRMADGAQRSTQLAALLSERLEILQAEACGSAGSGKEVRAPFHLVWVVTPEAGGRRVTVSGTSSTGVRRVVTVSRFIGCAA